MGERLNGVDMWNAPVTECVLLASAGWESLRGLWCL